MSAHCFNLLRAATVASLVGLSRNIVFSVLTSASGG